MEIDLRQIALFPLVVIAAPALAEEQPALPSSGATDEEIVIDEADTNEIVVIAARLVGSVDAPQPPLVTLDEEEIASYGASSVTELIQALGTQTTSSRGRGGGFPIMLINGQRISSFREMRNLPPEAIRRMEVLPEEVALRYGYPPNQRVVNMILKDNFSSKTVEFEYHRPTDGGFDQLEAEASLFQVAGKSRLNLTVSANDTSPLTEGERGIRQTAAPIPGDPDPADYRTLVADTRDFGFNGTWTTPIGSSGAGLTLNAAASTARSLSYSGLVANSVGTGPDETTRYFLAPLVRRSKTDTYQGGLNFSKPVGQWRLTTTVDASSSTTTTLITQRPDPVPAVTATGPLPMLTLGEDRARSRLDTITSLATLIGNPVELPAGEASLTLKAGFNYTGITSSDTRSGLGEIMLDRKDVTAGINLGLPLTSRREEVLGGIGDITLNLSGGINHLSDFGTLFDYSAGITWGITETLNFQASYIVNEAAPSLTNLGNPRIESPLVAVYDFTRDETALVTLITGGNPNLVKERQRDLKLSANWQLPFLERSSLQVEYIRNHSDDVTSGFPLLTPEIEAAFPGRVQRDASGRLIQIDQRPVTFDTIKSARLRYGVNLSGTLGKAQEGGLGAGGRGGSEAGRGGGGRGGPGAGRGGGRGPGGFGGRGGQGRWNLALFYTVRFDETVLIAPGGPLLDLLDGDALSGGGVSRHSLEIEGGAFYRGFGLRFNGTWSSPTRVESATSTLRFGSKFNLDLRAFVNLGQQEKLVKSVPFFKNARVSLEVDNLFNSRQRITDANGVVPDNYLPDLIDPRGRVVGIEFRKQF
jgi:iron complex outermembrane recepter protein